LEPGAGLVRSHLPAHGSSPDGRFAPVAPLGSIGFMAVVVASFGGPLALAALYVPTTLAGVSGSTGLIAVAGAVAFTVPLAVWLGYSRKIHGPAGLTGFVQAAAGRRVALAQAALWTASYLLYLIYTTVTIVYDILPKVLPGVRPYRPMLEVALPVVLAGVLLAGRRGTVTVLGIVAVGQLALVGALAIVTLRQSGPAPSYLAPTSAPVGPAATAAAQTSLLYVCGSLPLFLGGEVLQPTRTVRRSTVAGLLVAAAGVVAVAAPLAANPAFAYAEIPGVSMARVFAGQQFAVAVGLGIAASVAALMLVEVLALTRLLHAVTGFSIATMTRVLAVVLAVAGPVSLVDPEGFYNAFLKPSLVALWLSLLIVFLVYPRFAARYARRQDGRGARVLRALALAAGASAFAIYGIYVTFQQAAT
jgi:hypothetical protein